MKKLLMILGMLTCLAPLNGHTQVAGCDSATSKIMYYNLSQFQSCILQDREDTLYVILDSLRPDLFFVSEVKDSSAAALVLSVFNRLAGTNYEAVTFVPNQTDPSNTGLQNMAYYNADKYAFLGQTEILTGDSSGRDINKYEFQLLDSNLCEGTDPIYLDAFVAHLKAGADSLDSLQRIQQVDSLRIYLETHPVRPNTIFAGDFNIYNASEGTYGILLDSIRLDSVVVGLDSFMDPIDQRLEWFNDSASAAFHTQSTRKTGCPGGSTCFGTGGGMDNRFDFILVLSSLMDGSNSLKYIPGSYVALGNDGQHLNKCLLDPPTNTPTIPTVSPAMRSALYYMSDHLPVVMDLSYPINMPVGGIDPHFNLADLNLTNPVDEQLVLWIDLSYSTEVRLSVYSSKGEIVLDKSLQLSSGTNQVEENLSGLSEGLYWVRVQDKVNGEIKGKPLVIRR